MLKRSDMQLSNYRIASKALGAVTLLPCEGPGGQRDFMLRCAERALEGVAEHRPRLVEALDIYRRMVYSPASVWDDDKKKARWLCAPRDTMWCEMEHAIEAVGEVGGIHTDTTIQRGCSYAREAVALREPDRDASIKKEAEEAVWQVSTLVEMLRAALAPEPKTDKES